jgi:hypothetical protein
MRECVKEGGLLYESTCVREREVCEREGGVCV